MNADKFNDLYPVGTPVTYKDDFGELHETTTRSQAWDLGHGATVVAINGRTGGHDITRIEKRTVL